MYGKRESSKEIAHHHHLFLFQPISSLSMLKKTYGTYKRSKRLRRFDRLEGGKLQKDRD